MSDLEINVKLTTDGAELVRGTRTTISEVDKLKDSGRAAGSATDALAAASSKAASAMAGEARSAVALSRDIKSVIADNRALEALQAKLSARKFVSTAPVRVAEAKAARGLAEAEAGVASAAAKAATDIGQVAGRSGVAAQAQSGLAVAANASAAGLGGLRGVAAAAASEIASVAGVSQGSVAAFGAIGIAGGIAAGAVGLIGAAFGGGVLLAQSYQDKLNALRQAIAFAGQTSGVTADQLQADASRTAAATGQSYQAVLDASLKLVAGQQNSAAEVATLSQKGAELAATFGIDVATATEAVAGQFNALGRGDIASLNNAFGFLDEGTRQNIISLTEAGRTAAAQQVFVSALATKLHGAPGSLSTALGNAGSAIVDWAGSLVNSFGPIKSAIGLLQKLAGAAQQAANDIRQANAAEPPRAPAIVKNELISSIADLKQLRAQIRPGEVVGSANRLRFAAGVRRTQRAQAEFDQGLKPLVARNTSSQSERDAEARFNRSLALGPNGRDRFDKIKSLRDQGRDIARASGIRSQPALEAAAKRYADQEIRAADAIKAQADGKKALAASNKAERAGETARNKAEAARNKAEAETKRNQREAASAVREIASSLDALAGKFDPTLAAARDYEAVLKDIAALEKAGIKGGGIDKARADGFRAAAKDELDAQNNRDRDGLRREFDLLDGSAKRLRDTLKDIAALQARGVARGGIDSSEAASLRASAQQKKVADDIGRIARGRLEEAGTAGGEAFRRSGLDAVDAIAALFGDRVGGQIDALISIVKDARGGGFGAGLKELFKPLEKTLKDIFGDGGKFGKLLDTALKGAAFGKGATDLVGIKGSRTGGAVGGLIGKASGIPGLDAVGSILGSIAFGAFKKTKTGSSSLVFQDGQLGAGQASGNNGGLKRAASGAVGDIADALSGIAERLGGFVTGNAKVSIGFRKGAPVVDTDGLNRTKGGGTVKFAKDDTAGAVAFATANAIADGIIGGLSDKVSAALRSSTDIDKAVRTALNVDALEQSLAGVFGPATKAFGEFERQTAERLRLARQFGFDIVKVEATAARERKTLISRSVEEAVGDLRNVLESFRSGDRATGSLAERRDLLITERNRLEREAPTDSDAARKLASIITQIDDISLEAFGTAGGQFAADRRANTDIAQRIVDQANSEIIAASDRARASSGTGSSSTDILIKQSNELALMKALLDEANNQSAEMIALLGKTNSAIAALLGDGSDSLAAARAIGRKVLQ